MRAMNVGRDSVLMTSASDPEEEDDEEEAG